VATSVALLVLLLGGRRARAQETVTQLAPLQLSTTTGEKPQSKVWFHAGRWWAVLPSRAVTPTGTWLWRLGADNRWTNVLRLSSSTSAKADVRPVGELAHVLLHAGSSQLVSLQYVAAQQTYLLWTQRPTPTTLSVSGSEIATIDVDSTARMWLATESSSDVLVYYSDSPYVTFHGPLVVAEDIDSDDISVVTALRLPGFAAIGVLWSNQNTQRFGFRLHPDGVDPMQWLPDEVPAAQSALHVGHGMGDDHMNVKVGADGTLYAAVKTSYNTSGFPQIALLVRHPDGEWDDLYEVDDEGTRPIVILNEAADSVRVVYRDDGGENIVYRDSMRSAIGFGARRTLMAGPLNDPTSSKDNWVDQAVVFAAGHSVLIRRPGAGGTTTTVTTSTSTTRVTTTSTSSTTSTTPPGGVTTVEVRIAVSSDDAEERPTGAVSLDSSDLELLEDGGIQTVGLRFPGVAVPRGATIVNAWVQFQVDEAASGATAVRLEAQATDNAPTFTTAVRSLSSRARTSAFVSWSPPAWPVINVAGAEQRTPNLAAVIQQIVDRPGWASGNALALIATGSGRRVAEARDGSLSGAPKLHVEYVAGGPTTPTTSTTVTPATSTTTTTQPGGVTSVNVRVAASADDAEEAPSGKVSLTSSDLELVTDTGAVQTVGMRFPGAAIPRGAIIVAAHVQLQVDEPTTVATTVQIRGQASGEAAAFTTALRNVSARPRTTAAVSWSPPAWPTTGAAGQDQRTPSLVGVIQEIVNQAGWASGNALALIVTGTGERVAESQNGAPQAAPLLHVEYRMP
jgi:hypothetical protein